METPADPNIMPETDLGLVSMAKDIAYAGIRRFVGLCSYFPPEAGYPSERGAAAMLDAALCPDEVEAPRE